MWTYHDPQLYDRDKVRFLVGDTDFEDQQIQDEEIGFALDQEGNYRSAAAVIAESLAAKYARLVDKSVGDLSISYSQRATQFAEVAKKLRSGASISLAMPYAGGISVTDKESRANDTSKTSPAFKRGMNDNPEAESLLRNLRSDR